MLTNRFLSNNNACMYSLGSQKEAWVVEEVTAGWGVYDSTTKVWSVLTGVRVVRYAEEPARRVLQGAETSNVLNQISGLKRQAPGDADCGAPKRKLVSGGGSVLDEFSARPPPHGDPEYMMRIFANACENWLARTLQSGD